MHNHFIVTFNRIQTELKLSHLLNSVDNSHKISVIMEVLFTLYSKFHPFHGHWDLASLFLSSLLPFVPPPPPPPPPPSPPPSLPSPSAGMWGDVTLLL